MLKNHRLDFALYHKRQRYFWLKKENENEALEKAVSEGDEAALVEEYARKKGYVMPDERVYVDITPGAEE